MLEGALTLTVDHCAYSLAAGDGAVIFPNQMHSMDTSGQSRILLSIFDTDFCHSYRKQFQNFLPGSNIFSLSSLTRHSQTALDGLLGLTQGAPKEGPVPDNILALAQGYLTLLLADIFSHIAVKPKEVSQDLELEQRLLIYLDSHYTENLSLELLSKEFGISRFVLSRLFTDKLHISFPYYVNSKRLELAREMLISTDLSVTQIALDAGFGSPRTFFREFQQTFHVTPGEYRKNHYS